MANSQEFQRVHLQTTPIDGKIILDAFEFVRNSECGAVSSFLGCTRSYESKDSTKKKVISLHYESYEEMALKTMSDIVQKLAEEYPDVLHRIYVTHRLGRVDLGEASLLIVVGSPHRTTGHELTMKILNEIKQKVPIFKKVMFDDQQSQWSDASEAFWFEP